MVEYLKKIPKTHRASGCKDFKKRRREKICIYLQSVFPNYPLARLEVMEAEDILDGVYIKLPGAPQEAVVGLH